MPSFARSFEKELSGLVEKKAGYLSFAQKKVAVPEEGNLLSEIKELSSLLDTYLAISMSPHRKSEREDVIIRSELASELTPDQFRATTLDPSLWRMRKNGRFAPEYVHSSEYLDSLLTYENRAVHFIFALIRNRLSALEEQGVKDEGNSLEKLFQSPLSIFPEKGPLSSIGKDGKAIAKYLSQEKEDDEGKELTKALSKAKRLSLSSFSKTLDRERKEIALPLEPTNILVHDPRYNRLYRYYLTHLRKEKDDGGDSPYVYFAYRLLNELTKAGYRLAQEPNFKIKDGKYYITSFAFNKDGFLYHGKIEERTLRLEILYRGAVYRREALLFDTFLPRSENLDLLNDHYIVCRKNLSGRFSGILEADGENPKAVFPRLFEALSLVLDLDGRTLKHCPVCGSSTLVSSGKKELTCPACSSKLALLGGSIDPAVWVTSIRGR